MQYTITDILQMTRGVVTGQALTPFGENALATPIEHLLLDSRKIVFARTSVFFALLGRHDGHTFIPELYQAGVRCFVVSATLDTTPFPEAVFIQVKNTLDALQRLAALHRARFAIEVIGITGSNGKTIVKEWLFQLLQEDHNIVRSPKSYNSQTGVPLSVWQIHEGHDLGIFEAGISRKGEMARLAPIIRCNTGIFTMIGDAHSEGFHSIEEKIREKLELFREVQTLIYSIDDRRIDMAVQAFFGAPRKVGVHPYFTWSKKEAADLQVTELTSSGNYTALTALYRGETIATEIPFSDAASIDNAIHCWAYLLHKGYPNEVISPRMRRLEPIAMRLELKAGINDCVVVNDSYNFDLSALRIAVDFIGQQSLEQPRTIIISDMLQAGSDVKRAYREIAHLLLEKKFSRLIGIGLQAPMIQEFLPAGFRTAFYPDTARFLSEVRSADFQNETILLKGARPFAFERIAERLSLKAHRTVLEINLNALAHNLSVFQSLLRTGAGMMVMVKASAYGSGGFEVARLLEFHGVDYLAVAYPDEGIELRNRGVRMPILVLNADETSFDAMIRYQLEPEIYSLAQFRQFARMPLPPGGYPVHLKLDTGMHRLGFVPEDIDALLQAITAHPHIRIRSVFTHLAASEAPEHDAFTHEQATRFQEMYQRIISVLPMGEHPFRHILNSGGIVRFPEYHFEKVRLGIGLYGIDSSEAIQDKLQVVQTLKASISQVKTVRAGETVGYGRRGVVDRDIRIAIVSIGYADGLLRLAGNGRFALWVRGQRAPILGNVCMDMTMIDVTHIPEAREGDEVVVFGPELPVQELAVSLQTIPYEVFTGISERVKRVYYQE